MSDFIRDFTVHYAKGQLLTKSLQAACGKPWEWVTDIVAKVTCPECKEIINAEQNKPQPAHR